MNKVLAKIWHSKLVQQFVPDKLYLSLYFRKRFGYNMNWNNPQTFNEKIQWLKLYDRKVEYTGMVDKLESRDYISRRVGNKYLVKILGVYNDVKDIEYDSLPNRFVLKTTHDSGGVVVCKDKDKIDIDETNKILKKSLKFNYLTLLKNSI